MIINFLAAIVAASRGQADTEPSVNQAEEREIAKHQAIHSGLDLRSTVLAVILASALIGVLKDGKGIIPQAFLVAHCWICVSGMLAAGVSLFAASPTRDTTSDQKLKRLRRITRRKVHTNNMAIFFVILDAVLFAVGVTV